MYWIPALLMAISIHNWTMKTHVDSAWQGVTVALIMIAAAEQWLFGFRVELQKEQLLYRHRWLSFSNPICIPRDMILRAKFVRYNGALRIKSAHLELVWRAEEGTCKTYLTFASFSPENIRSIIAWLPVQLDD
ncbi:hypothetical protein [Kordiimonas gwangyangensis]|uniref:hypothetical protein n=2 Tax=Kordiimonas gwangyangensis TaxID=288022 RepID=UPI0003664258|nr:hypothetical protein [Kordiimonas gwangyangensis]